MKKIYYLLLLFVGMTSLVACTDDFDDVNRNPNKVYEAKPELVFPGVVYKAVNIYSKLNHEMLQTYASYVVNWKEQNDNDDNETYFEWFYVKSLNDLQKALRDYNGVAGYGNQVAFMKTWKAWEYFVLVSTFGPVPMSEATPAGVTDTYKYDSEADVYKQIFQLLDEAVDTIDINGDSFAHDPLLPKSDGSSDITKWKKFANSLRLYIALSTQNLDANQSEEEVRKCFANGNSQYLLSSNDDIVQFQCGTDKNADANYFYTRVIAGIEAGTETYGYTYPAMSHNFFIYEKSYNDPRLDKFIDVPTTTALKPLLRDDTLTAVSAKWGKKGYRDSIIVQYRVKYNPRRGGKITPPGWTVAIDPKSTRGETYRDPYNSIQTSGARSECLASMDRFMKADAKIVLLSYADVCFMKAEAAIKYPGVVNGSAKEFYEQGIKASMDQYGVSAKDANAYLAQNGVKWDTDGNGLWEYRHFFKADIKGKGGDENHLKQIYTQWWMSDWFWGFEGWVLDRRTRFLNMPPYFYNNATPVGGNGVCDWFPERLIYPVNEQSFNHEGYEGGVQKLLSGSREPNTSRGGDNFYTTLGIAAPQRKGLDKWLSGEIVYDGAWIRHPYGYTLEEVLKNTGCANEAALRKDYTFRKSVYSTYDPVTGYNVNTRTGELIDPNEENN